MKAEEESAGQVVNPQRLKDRVRQRPHFQQRILSSQNPSVWMITMSKRHIKGKWFYYNEVDPTPNPIKTYHIINSIDTPCDKYKKWGYYCKAHKTQSDKYTACILWRALLLKALQIVLHCVRGILLRLCNKVCRVGKTAFCLSHRCWRDKRNRPMPPTKNPPTV